MCGRNYKPYDLAADGATLGAVGRPTGTCPETSFREISSKPTSGPGCTVSRSDNFRMCRDTFLIRFFIE